MRFAPLLVSVPHRAIYTTDTIYAEHCTGLTTKSTCLYEPLRMAQLCLHIWMYHYVGTIESTCLYVPLRMAQRSLHVCTYHHVGTIESTCLYVPLHMAQQSLHVCICRYIWHNKVYMSVYAAIYGTTKSTCLYMPLYMAQPFWIICTFSNYPEDRIRNDNSASDTHVCHFCIRLLLATFCFPIHI